jgi:hypothetical protein
MPNIELRLQKDTRHPHDLIVTVQDATYEYLMSSASPEIRVSAYLDRDCANVEAKYAEIFVHEDCKFESKITKIIPGSRTRKSIALPGPMSSGEQLVVIVARVPKAHQGV